MIVVLSFIQLGLWSCFIYIELLVLILIKKDTTKNQLQICNEIYFIYFDFVKMIITMPTFIHVWWNWTVDWYWCDRQYLASKCSIRPLVLRTWSWNYELEKKTINMVEICFVVKSAYVPFVLEDNALQVCVIYDKLDFFIFENIFYFW